MASHNGPTDAPTDVLPHSRPTSSCSSAPPATWRSGSSCPASCHLSQAGLIPDCRIIGTSLEDLDDDGFRELASDACAQFGAEGDGPGELDEFAAKLSYVPQSAGPRRWRRPYGTRRASCRASPGASTT